MPITEITKVAGDTLTLLVMPEAERCWQRRSDEEERVEGSYDRFKGWGN